MRKILVSLLLFSLVNSAMAECIPKRTTSGRIARSTSEVAKFKRIYPCPATNKFQTSCPGYIVDHIIPLCKCGVDNISNMQWQTRKDSLIKDKIECK